jgi:hypothetical protein
MLAQSDNNVIAMAPYIARAKALTQHMEALGADQNSPQGLSGTEAGL